MHMYAITSMLFKRTSMQCVSNEVNVKKSTFIFDPVHWINKVVLCSGSNGVYHISEEVRNNHDEQIKTSVNPTLHARFYRIVSGHKIKCKI
jgi:hypothetical protein